jgi:pterin-4a-carbinolamine dehydratase
MTGLAFISYRREDTGPLAQNLYLHLKGRFGSGQLFMDVHSMQLGKPWPTQVQDKLQKATVVIALIGPAWLTAIDQYGRRRLDKAEDPVRLELNAALVQRKPIINLLVGREMKPPPDKALPGVLRGLDRFPCMELRPEVATWADDINSVALRLTKFGLKDNDPDPAVRPAPLPWKADLEGLTEDQLNQALDDLPGWDPWQDTLEQEYPNSRQELRKRFDFSSFDEAIAFMAYVAPRFTRLNHHPRWSNEWQMVQIRLSTWDAENKITEEDVRVAHEVDQAYEEFLAQRISPSSHLPH